MNAFQIKVLAFICMVIDHVGLFFLPQYVFLRVIGRVSFPLFGWLVAQGAINTRDIKRYLTRMFVLAVVSQVPFAFTNQFVDDPWWVPNVVFTLFLGLLAISVIKRTPNKIVWGVVTLACAATAGVLGTDYGAAGVFSIVAFFLCLDAMGAMFISQGLILGLLPFGCYLLETRWHVQASRLYFTSYLEGFGLISFLFIARYNHVQGPRAKYLFYVGYPIQYVAILAVKFFVT